LCLLATIFLKEDSLHTYALFPMLLPFFNAFWKLCSVRVFRTAYNSASITSIASKWRKTEKSQGTKSGEQDGWRKAVMLFLVKNTLVKIKCEKVHYHDATASYFVTKVRIKVFTHFHAVTVNRHSSMDCLACQDEFLMSRTMMIMLLTLLFTCLASQ
jgi:hypothetical protein